MSNFNNDTIAFAVASDLSLSELNDFIEFSLIFVPINLISFLPIVSKA